MHTHMNKTHKNSKLETIIYRQKTSKVKRKKTPKLPLSLFCVGHLLLGMGPALNVVCLPSKTHVEKLRKTLFLTDKT